MNDQDKHITPQEDQVDELFRNLLASHTAEPPPRVWKGIRRKLFFRELRHFNFTNVSYQDWLYLSIPIILLVVGLLVVPAEDQPSRTAEKVSSGQQTASPSAPSSVPVSVVQADPMPETRSGESGDISAGHKAGTRAVQDAAPPPAKPSYVTTEAETVAPSVESWLSKRRSVSGLQFVKPLEISMLPDLFLPDTFLVLKTVRGEEKFRIDKPGRVRSMITGQLGVLPELAFYDDGEKYRKMNYWLHGGVDWHISAFSIGTALELGYMYDQGKYAVDYKSRDSVGFYTVVVSYAAGPDNEVVYHTQLITLYDSILHRDDPRTTDRYTYLRIPMLLGYRIFEHNRFSLTFRAGPALTLLLGTRKGDPVIEYANARIIRIDEETPARMKTNWQLWADLMLEMRINEKYSLYLEPSWKYFFRPTADQENIHSKPPWSLGIGLGVQFNFEPNNRIK